MTKETNIIDAATATTADIGSTNIGQIFARLTKSVTQTSASVQQAQSKLKEGAEMAVARAQDIVSFSQGNIEALTKSTQIWAYGVQDLSKQVVSSAQTSAQEIMSIVKMVSTVKSVQDAISLQSNFARNALEKAVSEGGRLTEASLTLSRRAWAPITERIVVARDTTAKAA